MILLETLSLPPKCEVYVGTTFAVAFDELSYRFTSFVLNLVVAVSGR